MGHRRHIHTSAPRINVSSRPSWKSVRAAGLIETLVQKHHLLVRPGPINGGWTMRKRFDFYWVMLFVLTILLAATPVAAQSTATLQGTITDAQGAVMPGGSVSIKNTATGIERNTLTDSAGQYVAA